MARDEAVKKSGSTFMGHGKPQSFIFQTQSQLVLARSFCSEIFELVVTFIDQSKILSTKQTIQGRFLFFIHHGLSNKIFRSDRF